MRKLLFGLLLISSLCQAHIEGRLPNDDISVGVSCYSLAARATWGAYAQTLGAPAEFRYMSYEGLRAIFFADKAKIPTDGIYMLEDMNADEREQYQHQALIGYEWAEHEPGVKDLSRDEIMALFVHKMCNLK